MSDVKKNKKNKISVWNTSSNYPTEKPLRLEASCSLCSAQKRINNLVSKYRDNRQLRSKSVPQSVLLVISSTYHRSASEFAYIVSVDLRLLAVAPNTDGRRIINFLGSELDDVGDLMSWHPDVESFPHCHPASCWAQRRWCVWKQCCPGSTSFEGFRWPYDKK